MDGERCQPARGGLARTVRRGPSEQVRHECRDGRRSGPGRCLTAHRPVDREPPRRAVAPSPRGGHHAVAKPPVGDRSDGADGHRMDGLGAWAARRSRACSARRKGVSRFGQARHAVRMKSAPVSAKGAGRLGQRRHQFPAMAPPVSVERHRPDERAVGVNGGSWTAADHRPPVGTYPTEGEDVAACPGSRTVRQLGARMDAATRDPVGRASATVPRTAWYLAHGIAPVAATPGGVAAGRRFAPTEPSPSPFRPARLSTRWRTDATRARSWRTARCPWAPTLLWAWAPDGVSGEPAMGVASAGGPLGGVRRR
jgi:hypothetical protein